MTTQIKIVFTMTIDEAFDQDIIKEMKEQINSGQTAKELVDEFEDSGLIGLKIKWIEL
jgi:hypothetical protein